MRTWRINLIQIIHLFLPNTSNVRFLPFKPELGIVNMILLAFSLGFQNDEDAL